jgi:hypothetical protein
MKNLLKYSFLILALTLGTSIAAHADRSDDPHPIPPKLDPPKHDPLQPEFREAPEVDPSLAIGGFSLLAGTLMVLRAQRRK